jgi:dUTP pyrophosphatase
LRGDVALLPLGFKATLPRGFEAQIRMRSSWAFTRGLTVPNAPGTIDADFPDEWMVLVRASASGVTRIRHGDRVAQAVISQFQTVAWQEGTVQPVTDRAGGIGSTG